ncbi:hypothetical protein [Paraclostridium sordellii]|uniref:hypothetical protein n=1 Tax=Paraclostridium sordellii TaxID=1505 RepID=UPI0005E24391|nr:hypothetical protein [Paeniclostridium sordellii]CEP45205.1 Uncharacterised protein [[Clostridium] sordellii] [Paeniclostridium sordellii]
MVNEINDYLKNGGTISSFEREKGFGKDTVRKKLNRLGYSYNKGLKQFVTQDVTQKSNTKVIKNNESAYPIKSNKKECQKMELADFKKLSTKEQIDFVNQFTDGKKTLKQIEREYFNFKNIGLYINRNEGFWDGKLKKFTLIEPKNNFSEEEIKILKEIINNHKIKKEINLDKNDEIVLKSIRAHKSSLDKLADYCKKNKVKQQDILSLAIEQYIQNN